MKKIPTAPVRLGPKVPFYKRRGFKDNVFVATLLAWPIIHFLVFWVYVNFRSILLTFQRFDVQAGKYVWDGGVRFTEFFKKMILGTDPVLHNAFKNSVFSVVINLCVILPLAFFAAYVFYKKIPGERFFRVMFFLPSMISAVVLTLSYRYMFNTDFGPVALAIKQLFGYAPDWLNPSGSTIWPVIYIYCIWAGLGYNVIMLSGAMNRIPIEIRECARLDGVGFWRECFSIALPLAMPTVSTYVVIGVLGMFSFMMQPMFIAGNSGANGHSLTVAWHIFNLVQMGTESHAINAATIGLVMVCVGSPFVFLSKLIMDRLTPDVEI